MKGKGITLGAVMATIGITLGVVTVALVVIANTWGLGLEVGR